jgi:spermidine/putrescine transport system permease protein
VGSFLRRHRGAIPYLLLAPGLLYLAAFYVYPFIQMGISSFWTGSLERGYVFSLENWTTYPAAIERYSVQFGRSLLYGSAATILTFLIAYPLAYAIAFRAGRYKNLMLLLVVAPFFTSFLLRTVSWRIILGDDGLLFAPLKGIGLLDAGFRVLATPIAVISGITYNFLPFMVLPIYVSLEKIDKRLIEAAQDLYAGPWRPGGFIAGGAAGTILFGLLGFAFNVAVPVMAGIGLVLGALLGGLFLGQAFIRVTLPLSLPGVFAGSLLVLIPALGDYVNSALLGNPATNMIGNVIQSRFLTNADYPTASALSVILMIGILIAVGVYARVLGTENLTAGRGG